MKNSIKLSDEVEVLGKDTIHHPTRIDELTYYEWSKLRTRNKKFTFGNYIKWHVTLFSEYKRSKYDIDPGGSEAMRQAMSNHKGSMILHITEVLCDNLNKIT